MPDFLLASKNLSLSHSLTSLTKHKHMVLLKISLTHSTLTHPTHSLTHSYQSIRQGPPDALAALLVSLHRVPVHQRPTSVSACQLFSVLHVCDWLSETGLLTASSTFARQLPASHQPHHPDTQRRCRIPPSVRTMAVSSQSVSPAKLSCYTHGAPLRCESAGG